MTGGGAFSVWFQRHFSNFDFSYTTTSLPLSVCLSHIKACRYGNSASLDAFIGPAVARLTLRPAVEAVTRHCDGTKCWICSTRSRHVAPSSKASADETDSKSSKPPIRSNRCNDGSRPEPSVVDAGAHHFQRSRWQHNDVRLLRGRPSVSSSPTLSSSDVITLGHAMSTSTRSAAVGARHLADISAIRPPSSAVIRRDSTRRNKLFSNFFHSTDVIATLSPNDGALHTCHSLVDFVRCVIWIRNKTLADVALFRFSADAGQGDLKISFQIVYSDDTVFTASSRAERSLGGCDSLDASVKRTFIMALMNNASESYESLFLMFQSLDLAGVKALLPHANFVFPVDMKLANIVLGLGPVGCAFPYAYSLWSPFKKHSQPGVRRTIASIVRDDAGRRSAMEATNLERKENVSQVYQRFHSVYHRPMPFVELFVTEHISDFIVPAQLHILIGIAKDLFDGLHILEKDIAALWLSRLGVRHDERHGRTGFVGNDCRKIAAGANVLDTLMSTSFSGDRTDAVAAIVTALRCFDDVINATFSVHLRDDWAAAIAKFGAAHAVLAKVLSAAKPYQAHRSEERVTPKMRCLLEEVPLWIARHGTSLLQVSEQSFESLHHFYIMFAARFKIPRSGHDVPTQYRQKPAAVADGARGGTSKARKRKKTTSPSPERTAPKVSKRPRRSSVSKDPAPPPLLDAPHIVGQKLAARTQRMKCLLAYNLRALPVDVVAQDRIDRILRWSPSDGAPPWMAPIRVCTCHSC